MEVHTFLKEGDKWYIHLPEYLEQGGKKEDLEMVQGADDLLNIIATAGEDKITLQLDTEHFEGANLLELKELGNDSIGGGYYYIKTLDGKPVSRQIWLHDVTLFVFGDMPQTIYFKKHQ